MIEDQNAQLGRISDIIREGTEVAYGQGTFGRAAVLERVRGVLVKTSCRDVPQEDGVRLHEDLELDSAERIETAMRLEEEFGVALSDDEVDQMCMSTLGGITDYLMSQKGVA